MTTYKLSSNENPFPPLPGIEEAVARAAARMNRYPDAGSTALYAALAARLGVATEQLAAGTGSVAVLYHLLQAFCDPGDRVVTAWRSFEAYPIAIGINAAEPVQVPLTADGRHDLDAMAAAAAEPRTKVVVLCTPNNPTGPALTHGEVEDFLARVPGEVLVVVDEAYREFVRLEGAVDGVALLAEHPNVVVMRTFAKAYGLAGLRVGYAVAHPDVAAAIRACALPFGVSAPAQAAAVAALEHEAELMERVEAIVTERERVVEALTAQGWDLPETHANFVWLATGERTADLVTAAEEAGIVLRPFAGEGVRASIGEREANDRLVEVAAKFVP
ncbi:putative phenylalanine aminotransferase [Marmoricola endophyticus]|uniref:Histidinol-phosphate aminotransferase n=2 Tax=Marmoricola endophyticus TaxID=2040280 RepID=A0A917F5Q8_9ACTN|nr:putative phenylalanine aminotransferase [Marmoricola endophyticus]